MVAVPNIEITVQLIKIIMKGIIRLTVEIITDDHILTSSQLQQKPNVFSCSLLLTVIDLCHRVFNMSCP